MNDIYRSKAYMDMVNEHFDITDTKTRKILLSVNEADQAQIMQSLTSRLYDRIVDKVDDIDFGDIPSTKGDITKLPNYDKIMDSIDIIRNILVESKQDVTPINTVATAVENIRTRKELFNRAYMMNVELPIITYNSVCLAIISSISFLISACIEFIKTPNADGFEIAIDKVALAKTKQNLVFDNLAKFNESCRKGDVDKAMDYVIKGNVQNLAAETIISGIAVGLGIFAVLFNLIPILQELVFFFYYSRTRVSDYFDMQADLLQMNAHNLELTSTRDPEETKKIVKKQMKIVDMFRKISNKLQIKCKEAEVKATKEIVANNKKNKIDDMIDSVPDSASSVLF